MFTLTDVSFRLYLHILSLCAVPRICYIVLSYCCLKLSHLVTCAVLYSETQNFDFELLLVQWTRTNIRHVLVMSNVYMSKKCNAYVKPSNCKYAYNWFRPAETLAAFLFSEVALLNSLESVEVFL